MFGHLVVGQHPDPDHQKNLSLYGEGDDVNATSDIEIIRWKQSLDKKWSINHDIFEKRGFGKKWYTVLQLIKTREIKVAGKYTLNFTQWQQKNTKEVEKLLERSKNPIARNP